MPKHFNVKIIGRVQGIGFRYSTIEQAGELGIRGFVRNEPDDSVYIEAEGEEAALQEFIEWCRNGPSFARVQNVEVQEGEPKDFTDFRAT